MVTCAFLVDLILELFWVQIFTTEALRQYFPYFQTLSQADEVTITNKILVDANLRARVNMHYLKKKYVEMGRILVYDVMETDHYRYGLKAEQWIDDIISWQVGNPFVHSVKHTHEFSPVTEWMYVVGQKRFH